MESEDFARYVKYVCPRCGAWVELYWPDAWALCTGYGKHRAEQMVAEEEEDSDP